MTDARPTESEIRAEWFRIYGAQNRPATTNEWLFMDGGVVAVRYQDETEPTIIEQNFPISRQEAR